MNLADMPALGIERHVGAPRRERLVKARPFWVTPKKQIIIEF